jgi:hypothetical protein
MADSVVKVLTALKKSQEVVTMRIEQRVAELQLLAAATAVAWGRSPGRPFERIADEARDSTDRFIEAHRCA